MWTKEMEEEYERREAARKKREDIMNRAVEEATPGWDWRKKVGDETGSEGRFHDRIKTYDAKRIPRVSHHFWWFVHNVVAHPMIGVLPIKASFDFHDYTSKKINGV